MQKVPGQKPDDAEITLLLRTLRIEVSHEANFEERFMYDFRERLAREAVCRPARLLLWEHLLHLLTNVGRRRIWWSSASAAALLCVCAVAWYQSVPGGEGSRFSRARTAASAFTPPVISGDAASAEDVAHIIVNRRAARKSYAEQLMVSRLPEGESYSLGMAEEPESAALYNEAMPLPGSPYAEGEWSLPEMPLPGVR